MELDWYATTLLFIDVYNLRSMHSLCLTEGRVISLIREVCLGTINCSNKKEIKNSFQYHFKAKDLKISFYSKFSETGATQTMKTNQMAELKQ